MGVFGKLKSFFGGEESLEASVTASLEKDMTGEPTNEDLHIATVVLLIEMAGKDQDIAPEEAEEICYLMEEQFGIENSKIPGLVETAMAVRKEQGKIDEFVNYINQRFDKKQRKLILSMIWKVIIADGEIDKFEQKFATQMKFRFQLNDEDAHEARCMAERGDV